MGGFCLNEWLIQKGYLVLKEPPTPGQSLEDAAVDWSQTRAWGAGGYYGRIFFNVKGREPQGCLTMPEYEGFRQQLAAELSTLTGPQGEPWQNQIHIPQQTYQRVRGVAPDLLVYFDHLAWRSIGTLGHGSLYTTGNDTGPDDANHAQYGLMIFYDPRHPQGGKVLDNAQIYDILPTLLHRYGIERPGDLRGKSLLSF
jgi:predicted AlkP superfamily phosphohydrolase/phosphomutase